MTMSVKPFEKLSSMEISPLLYTNMMKASIILHLSHLMASSLSLFLEYFLKIRKVFVDSVKFSTWDISLKFVRLRDISNNACLAVTCKSNYSAENCCCLTQSYNSNPRKKTKTKSNIAHMSV